jgi:hypothetical protein
LHESLVHGNDDVLLSGDGHALAIQWRIANGGTVLVVANGSFLLNLPLANPARRPLAEETASWIGQGPKHIAFVTGFSVLGKSEGPVSLIQWIIEDPTTRWIALHLGLFGVISCLARAPILGRPRPDPPSDADRPAAHAEAIGALLQRADDPEAARALLASYRRWRFPRTPQEPHRSPARSATNF